MKKTKPSGVVVSGRLAESVLLRLPVLTEHLGPVAASSKRLASRYANTLRRGWAAGDWAELSVAKVIYIQAPEPELPAAIDALLAAIPRWERKIAVLLDERLDCSVLRPLAKAGAAIASLAHAPMSPYQAALLEGDPEAMQLLRPMLRRSGVKTIHLQPGSKLAYSAGVALGGILTVAVTEMAIRAVRAAGIDPATAKRIVGRVVEVALRDTLANGRNSWLSPGAGNAREATLAQTAALMAAESESGLFAIRTVRAAMEMYGEDASWLAAPAPAAKAHRAP
jgi:predicted short-subunit dehydrogenase-like oxidoreductase (DUF2520 family)